ncbi:hypothetical protein QBC34DRAFT_89463 [Podospora aff. communis PSN243]|uniref:CFEM domain-containing protein n=1 Tax=Podospora aff. communis PSN243 TaxID=3040156 RepID=A0AAV9GMX9_9PEZI|nr:hypothetical protein QBC34DRAFT_89463 [Podospora aff. communis PSN243]
MLHQQLLLAGAVLLLALTSQADAAPLALSECVAACVASSGCESKDTKCVCKAAKDDFLETVVTCMYYHCKDELHGVDSVFLNLVKTECEADKRAIPKKEIDQAKKTASSLIAKLPKTTAPTMTRPLPVPTPAKTTATTVKTSSSFSRSSSSLRALPSSEPEPSPPIRPTTPVLVPGRPPTSTLTVPPDATITTTQGGSQGVPTDSSPFATLESSSSRVDVPWLIRPLLFLIRLAFR